jgi:hypothetical protein
MTGDLKPTRLDMAMKTARAYRWALLRADPQACTELDEQARAAKQHWIAPQYIPTAVAEEAITATLVPARIAEVSGVPTGTIYSWISRGLLTPAPREEGDDGPAKYLVRDVLAIEGRRRVRRLDSA